MFCEEVGTKERLPRLPPPTTKSDNDFHRWAGVLYRDYLELYKSDSVLLNCWNTEQQKREKAR